MMLYRLSSLTILGPWKRQGVEAICAEPCPGNTSQPELWFHCPGAINPADLPSRGLSMMELAVNQLWRAGPKWLGFDMPVHSELSTPEPCSQELNLTSEKSHTLLVAEKTPTWCIVKITVICRDSLESQHIFSRRSTASRKY